MNATRPTLDDVLQEIQTSVSAPDSRTAQDWCARFPEFAEDIRLFIGEWLYQLSSNTKPGSFNVDLARLRANSDLINRLHDFRSKVKPAGIIATAQASGVEVATLARDMHCSVELIERLDEKGVELSSIPDRFIAVMAQRIGTSIDWLVGWLGRAPSASAIPVFSRGALAPMADTSLQSFETAWSECGLAQADLEFWTK